jgi:23S rRNA pseudouridine1911/1915/1917 synthase
VSRLDKDTTGLVVFARTLAAKRALARQLRAHTVTRRYLAIVHGEARDGRHETLLVPNRGDGLRGSWGRFRRARGDPPREARRAVTHVRVVERLRGATLVECRLETGRQHQIRIHLAEAGHPLVGERVYIRDYRGERIDAPRPMLHAETLGFTHPSTKERVELSRPPPPDFDAVLRRLR